MKGFECSCHLYDHRVLDDQTPPPLFSPSTSCELSNLFLSKHFFYSSTIFLFKVNQLPPGPTPTMTMTYKELYLTARPNTWSKRLVHLWMTLLRSPLTSAEVLWRLTTETVFPGQQTPDPTIPVHKRTTLLRPTTTNINYLVANSLKHFSCIFLSNKMLTFRYDHFAFLILALAVVNHFKKFIGSIYASTLQQC